MRMHVVMDGGVRMHDDGSGGRMGCIPRPG